ncbi:phage terminase large subunit [Pseudomonas chlororaphis]|uniref:phage terminase large subunit n=1 Tax=Pseudomonas chlororaphis TaxID=587753 RepID=UPI00215A1562|nr:phage terminase large subunit [Pseudomonas chlororaphis]UVE47598.1 phage terminase large subunit [Pseudomonas chlororaphis]
MEITPQEAAQILLARRAARSNYLDFILYIDPDYIVSEFARKVSQACDEFLTAVLAGERPVLILQAPPQHGKSQLISRLLPPYIFGRCPDLSIAGLSYGADLASDMNRDVQRIMLGDEYRALFPKSALRTRRATRSEVEAKRNSEVFEISGQKGVYRGAGIGGPLTGKKVDIGIIDDPIKNSQEALSLTVKEGIWSWYQSTFLTRLSKNSGQIIMATSWAADDLSGRVIKQNARAVVLKFPALNLPGETGYNAQLAHGALVPELHPIEKLQETKSTLSDYFWSAMYQQSPKPAGGAIFKEEWFRYYLPKDLPQKFDKIILSWDMTFKDTTGSDFVVGQVWGKCGANSYLLEQVRDRMAFTATKAAFKSQAGRWPAAQRKLIEDKANGPAVIDSLKSTVHGIIPVEPDGSKIARAHAVTTYWEAGNIWIPHEDIAPWVKDFVSEVTTFPAAANDDQVDGMTQALRDLYTTVRSIFS